MGMIGVLVALLAAACGGRAVADGASSGGTGGGAGAANADSGAKPNTQCISASDGKTLLATGLRAVDHVAGPLAPGDPIVVREYADQPRIHLIDPQTCEETVETLPEGSSIPIALGDVLVWIDASGARMRVLSSRFEAPLRTRATPIALHADGNALYLISAEVGPDWKIADNREVHTIFIDRLLRSGIGGPDGPKTLTALDVSTLPWWNGVRVAGSELVLAFGFSYQQLDVSDGQYVARLRMDTLTSQWFQLDAVSNFVVDEGSVLVQRSADLLLFLSSGDGMLLRANLDHLALSGVASGYVIAADSWNDRKLLALGLDGREPRVLADQVSSMGAVSVSQDRVYWANSSNELWTMMP